MQAKISMRANWNAAIRSTFIALLATATALLGACSSQNDELADPSAPLPDISIEGFETVTAELDFETATATTPITPYVLLEAFETDVLLSQAHDALVRTCMRGLGYEQTSISNVVWESLTPRSDRYFGLWNRAEAAQFGYDLNPNVAFPRHDWVEDDQAYLDAIDQCVLEAEANELITQFRSVQQNLTIADRIQGNSYVRALNSKAGKAAQKRYLQCMKDESIEVDENGFTSSNYRDLGKESEIIAALAEVDCNISSKRIQTLYDTAAQYQAAYMKKYEEQLDAVLELKQQTYEDLRSIIEANP